MNSSRGQHSSPGPAYPPRLARIAPAELESYEAEPAVDQADLLAGQTVQEYVAQGAEGGEEQYRRFAEEAGEDG